MKSTYLPLLLLSGFWAQSAVAQECPLDLIRESLDQREYEQRCAEHAELMQAAAESKERAARGENPPGGYLCRDVLTSCRGAWNKPSTEMWGRPDYWARTDDLTGKSWQQVSWTEDSRIGRDSEFGIQCNTSGVPLAYASFSSYMSRGPSVQLAVRVGETLFSELTATASADGLSYTVSDDSQVAAIVQALRTSSGEIVVRGWDYNGVPSTLNFDVGAASEALGWLPCLGE